MLSNSLINKYYELLENIRENYSGCFHAIYASNELGIKKADPEIYKKVLHDYNLSAQDCVFVNDKEKNLQPAKEMGMYTVLIRGLSDLKENLKEFKPS